MGLGTPHWVFDVLRERRSRLLTFVANAPSRLLNRAPAELADRQGGNLNFLDGQTSAGCGRRLARIPRMASA